jgi:DNA-binding NarL/FixJ family response regulator
VLLELLEAKQRLPDVVIIDLNMPGPDATSVIPEIRRRWPRVRILVWTGRDARQARQVVPDAAVRIAVKSGPTSLVSELLALCGSRDS